MFVTTQGVVFLDGFLGVSFSLKQISAKYLPHINFNGCLTQYTNCFKLHSR